MFFFTVGTEFPNCEGTVVALWHNKQFVQEMKTGQLVGIILDQTCFYAEQGGQICDEGFMTKYGDKVHLAYLHMTVSMGIVGMYCLHSILSSYCVTRSNHTEGTVLRWYFLLRN